MKPLRYVFINLEEDEERQREFLKEFPNVAWWRFPACRGGLMWGEIARGLGLLGDLRTSWAGKIPEPLWGTVGCSLSHVLCLKLATVAGGIVLFPDDAVNLGEHHLPDLVAQALEHRPPGCGWIKLKNHHPVYAGPVHESGGWTFRRLEPVDRRRRVKANNGSAGVIILRRQARAMLKALPPLTSNHFDYELRHIVDRIPGGCWEMCGTGIDVRTIRGPFKGSVRRMIDGK